MCAFVYVILGRIFGFLATWQSNGIFVLIQYIFTYSCFGICQPGKVAGELVGEASDVGQLLVVHITEPGNKLFSLLYAASKGDNVDKGGEKQTKQQSK